MVRNFVLVPVTAILLAACSSASYEVNPPSVAEEEPSPVTSEEPSPVASEEPSPVASVEVDSSTTRVDEPINPGVADLRQQYSSKNCLKFYKYNSGSTYFNCVDESNKVYMYDSRSNKKIYLEGTLGVMEIDEGGELHQYEIEGGNLIHYRCNARSQNALECVAPPRRIVLPPATPGAKSRAKSDPYDPDFYVNLGGVKY